MRNASAGNSPDDSRQLSGCCCGTRRRFHRAAMAQAACKAPAERLEHLLSRHAALLCLQPCCCTVRLPCACGCTAMDGPSTLNVTVQSQWWSEGSRNMQAHDFRVQEDARMLAQPSRHPGANEVLCALAGVRTVSKKPASSPLERAAQKRLKRLRRQGAAETPGLPAKAAVGEAAERRRAQR